MKFLEFAVKVLRFIFIIPIVLYQKLISPLLPSSCIYYPSCSHYSKKSITEHGVFKGMILSITRILRCTGTFFTGGKDPVPDKFSFRYICESYKAFFKYNKK